MTANRPREFVYFFSPIATILMTTAAVNAIDNQRWVCRIHLFQFKAGLLSTFEPRYAWADRACHHHTASRIRLSGDVPDPSRRSSRSFTADQTSRPPEPAARWGHAELFPARSNVQSLSSASSSLEYSFRSIPMRESARYEADPDVRISSARHCTVRVGSPAYSSVGRVLIEAM